MTLKTKLTALIASFTLVIGLMLMGVFAVNQATVNMGGSISFTATDVYAHVTGSIANDTSSPSNLDVTYSAEETTGDPTVWNDLSLAFDAQATPIEVTITVENLSPQNTLRVNLNDTLSSTVGNLEKVVKNDGGDYTNQTDITLQPNGQADDSTTFTITMSVTNKNNSLTADFDYELNLFDQYYVETYEYFTFEENGDGTVELSAFDEDLAPSTDIVIPASVSLVDGVWFEGDDYTVTSIESYAFYGYSGLTNITLPSSLTSIGEGAFYGCSGLTMLDLSNCTNLTSIGNEAFRGCSGLTNITLPISLTSIGDEAFRCRDELEILEYKGTIDQWLSISFGWNWMDDSSHAFIVNGKELTNLIIPEGVTSIGYETFAGCSRITSITLPSSVTSIGTGAFSNCSGITSITLPSRVTSIEDNAFDGCSGLTSIVLSNCTRLETIGYSAFNNCDRLTSVTINQYVFENVTSTSSSCGYILNYIGSGGTVYVPANLIDDLGLTNSYLDGSSFTRSATANEDGYYVYTKI